MCRFAFDDLRLERLTLHTDIDNVDSQRVAGKPGFRREAEPDSGRPEGADPAVFSLRPGELH